MVAREYEPWEREHILIDTAGRTVEECELTLRRQLPENLGSGKRQEPNPLSRCLNVSFVPDMFNYGGHL